MSDFFLWGGFVFTLLWHGISWFGNENSPVKESILGKDDSHFYTKQTLHVLQKLNVGLSGVALCCFGYLAFGTI